MSAYKTCVRPKCKSVGADADHVIVFGERNEMRLPVCVSCALDAMEEGFEAHAAALDEDWSKLNALVPTTAKENAP
jgi:hypothetical protein